MIKDDLIAELVDFGATIKTAKESLNRLVKEQQLIEWPGTDGRTNIATAIQCAVNQGQQYAMRLIKDKGIEKALIFWDYQQADRDIMIDAVSDAERNSVLNTIEKYATDHLSDLKPRNAPAGSQGVIKRFIEKKNNPSWPSADSRVFVSADCDKVTTLGNTYLVSRGVEHKFLIWFKGNPRNTDNKSIQEIALMVSCKGNRNNIPKRVMPNISNFILTKKQDVDSTGVYCVREDVVFS